MTDTHSQTHTHSETCDCHDHQDGQVRQLRDVASQSPVCCELHGTGSAEGAIVFALIGGVLVLTTVVAKFFGYQEDIRQIPAAIGALLLLWPLLNGAYREIKRGRPSSSFLVALAIGAALAVGEYVVAGGLAFILYMMDKVIQRTAWGAHKAIEQLVQLTPDTARQLTDDGEHEVSLEQLKVGDIIRVRPGENLPADGNIVTGSTSINMASLTGEADSVEAEVGEPVYAGTTNLTGGIDVEITRLGTDTTIGKVVTLINEAEQSKTPRQQIIELVAGHYVWVVLMIAMAVWILSPKMVGDAGGISATQRAITVLVVTCPGALLLSSPTALVAAFAAAARLGIMVKSTSTLEAASAIDTVVLDKTGTLTTGRFDVSRLAPADGIEGAELLAVAANAEQHSNHPLAQSIVQTAKKAKIQIASGDSAEELHGLGVKVTSGNDQLFVGRAKWLLEINPAIRQQVTDIENRIEGMTGVHVMKNDQYLGAVGLEDKIRKGAAKAVAALRDEGVRWVGLLTGDRVTVANRVGQVVPVDHIEAECHPEEKHDIIQKLTSTGRCVMMVGDGINDGPSLAASDVGVAMGLGGTDIAANSAGIALMSDDLSRLPFVIRLAKKTRVVITQNIIASIIIAIAGLSLAASGNLSFWEAGFYHALADVFVIANSFRLVRFGEEHTETGRAYDTSTPMGAPGSRQLQPAG